jgi:ParB family chromosome partitioning protein
MGKSLSDKLRDGAATRLAREALGERSDRMAPDSSGPDAPRPTVADPEAGWTRDRARKHDLLELARIAPDLAQPRKQFDRDDLDRLRDSVRARGILQPVRVRWDGERWILVAGERRYRGAVEAGLAAIPAVRVDGRPTDAEVLEEQIAEQLLRCDWSPIEEARALQCIMQLRRWEQWELCRALHLSRSSVSRSLALLELHAEVQAMIDRRELPATAAIELRKLEIAQQPAVAQAVICEKLTVPETVERVAAVRGKPDRAPRIPHKRRVLRCEGGTVTVKLKSGAVGDIEVRDALRQVLRDLDLALQPRFVA